MDEGGAAEHRVDLVGLQVADHVEPDGGQVRVACERGGLAHELLGAVLPEHAVARGDGGAAGGRVVHLARANEGNLAYGAARLFGGRGDVCAHARDVFSNAHF